MANRDLQLANSNPTECGDYFGVVLGSATSCFCVILKNYSDFFFTFGLQYLFALKIYEVVNFNFFHFVLKLNFGNDTNVNN